MDNPFDDPTFRAAMEQLGVVHQPGMAAAHLAEMAPLLKAEGIDLDNLGPEIGLEELNAAMARATEQHNFMLMTPVGVHRDGALGALRGVAEALADGDDATAEDILARIQPDPQPAVPSVAHLIGTALGLLDTWHADPAMAPKPMGIRIAKWDSVSRAAARDVVTLAKQGRAFDTVDALMINHTGKPLFRGAALAVAGAVAALARHSGRTVAEIAAERIGGTIPEGAAGSAFRRATGAPDLVRAFARWAHAHPEDVSAPTPDDAIQMLDALFGLAAEWKLNPAEADDVLELADGLVENRDGGGSDGYVDNALSTLSDFAFFHVDTAPTEEWEFTLDEIEKLRTAEDDPLADLLDTARERAMTVPEADRMAAIADLRILTAVPHLLDWLGTGRGVTQTGGIRRADIADVAALLGVSAIGVAKRTASVPGEPLAVRSASELPVLSAWWEALRIAEVIEVTATRVLPGDAAHDVHRHGGLSPETQHMLVGTFVTEVVLQATEDGSLAAQMIAAVMMTDLARLAAARPRLPEPDGGDEMSALFAQLRSSAHGELDPLAQAGLLQLSDAGEYVLDPALGEVIVLAVLLARTLVDRRLDDMAE